jgi:zinc D-Ala-D-Ala carboxypeptidase
MSDRQKWNHFELSEFDSPDEPGSGLHMSWDLIDRLDRMREDCGFPFIVTSGYRTRKHNEEIGGEDESDHLTGNAADIAVHDGYERYMIVKSAYKHGVRRIGVKKDCIHLGNRYSNPQDVMWTYD